MFCTKCGSKFDDGNSFCPICGSPTGVPPKNVKAVDPFPNVKPVQPMNKKKNTKILIIVIAAVLLLAAAAAVVFFVIKPFDADDGEKRSRKHHRNDDSQVVSDDVDDDYNSDYKVALITDYGDITDEAFNQTAYEACLAFCKENDVDFKYYKPAGNSTSERIDATENAIYDGYNIIVMPGYAFAGTLVEVAPQYKDIKFIALDVNLGDLLEAAVSAAGESYDYNPDNWNLSDYFDMSNVYCATYAEEISGYMAGYAAVSLGYEKLGFLGGMAVPSVIRYGYGFVQGADAAAKALDKHIEIKYVYAGQFYGDSDITAVMDTWYAGGTEVVFACGGGVYVSVAEAAAKYDAKVIGVETDQAAVIDADFGDGMTVTSAMKGLYPTVTDALTAIVLNDSWDVYAGMIETLGLVSGTDPEHNFVQLPLESTQWSVNFDETDYLELVEALYYGDLTVSDSIGGMPATTNTTVNDQGSIKG